MWQKQEDNKESSSSSNSHAGKWGMLFGALAGGAAVAAYSHYSEKTDKSRQVAKVECSKCMENLHLSTLNCGHILHSHCLIDWITRNKSCPTCKVAVMDDEFRRIRNQYAAFQK